MTELVRGLPSRKTKAPTRSERGRRRSGRIFSKPSTWIGLASVFGGLALWELLTKLFDISPLVLAPPSQIAVAFRELSADGVLWGHIRTSVGQFVVGFAIAGVLGILIGLLMGQFRYFRYATEPWVLALYATPSIGLAPLFIIWLGFGFTAKAFIVALMVFFPVAINTLAGVEGLAREWKDVAGSFKANAFEQFFKVSLPGSLPFIFAGLRLGVGRGLVGIVVADFFGAQQGLGFLILQGAQRFRTTDVFVGTLVLAGLGVLFTTLLTYSERKVCPWRRDEA